MEIILIRLYKSVTILALISLTVSDIILLSLLIVDWSLSFQQPLGSQLVRARSLC